MIVLIASLLGAGGGIVVVMKTDLRLFKACLNKIIPDINPVEATTAIGWLGEIEKSGSQIQLNYSEGLVLWRESRIVGVANVVTLDDCMFVHSYFHADDNPTSSMLVGFLIQYYASEYDMSVSAAYMPRWQQLCYGFTPCDGLHHS